MNSQDTACTMFCENLNSITRASVVAWLHKVKLFKNLGQQGLEKLAQVAHFRSLAVGNTVLKQGEKVTRLQVVLSGSLEVSCESQAPGAEPGTQVVVAKTVVAVSWAADHRVVDGATMANFSNVVRGLLEQPATFLDHLK